MKSFSVPRSSTTPSVPDKKARLVLDARPCRHCQSLFSPNAESDEFCCAGCEGVFHFLEGSGLSNFYRLQTQNPPTCPLPAQVSSESFAYCDDSEIQNRYAKGDRLDFFVEGLNCSACLWLLEKMPDFEPCVARCEVNFSKSIVRITRHPGGSFAKAAQALNRLGYRPHLIESEEEGAVLRSNEQRRDLVRIGVAAFCTGNIMLFAVSLYGGASGTLGSQFHWVTAALSIPVLTFSAWPFYRSAVGSLRAFKLNLDVPIVAALWSGITMSVWGLISSKPTLYFDSLSLLVLLLLSSRTWLKSLQQKHLDSSRLEDHLLLGTVERVNADGFEKVSTLSVVKGDQLRMHAQMTVPTDGLVLAGKGTIQTAALTGELLPHSIHKGEKIFAGSECLAGEWLLEVSTPASDSRLARLLKDAAQASRTKPRLELLADRVGRWFVAIVMSLASALVLIALFTPYLTLEDGFSRALALIIVTCPCVFGMAIPLSLSLAVRSSARRGLILKEANVIERLGKIKDVFFDKTGTLTNAQLSVLNFINVSATDQDLAALVALERDQDHPVAEAIRRHLKTYDQEFCAVDTHHLPGRGIRGVVETVSYSIQSSNECSKIHGQPATGDHRSAIRMEFQALRDSEVIARFALGDSLKTEARETVRRLQARGLNVQLLSGDQPSVVERVSRLLSIYPKHVNASASPEEKAEILKSNSSSAVMVGDGANDSFALASAAVGIAVRGSLDVSLKAADVYLLKPDLRSIDDLFEIAKRTHFAIVRNLLFSATFNLFAGTLAVTGHMQPLYAAILMPISSLTVLASALWTGRSL